MEDILFRNEHKESELGNVCDVLTRPRLWVPTSLDYPSHGEWVEKVEAQLGNGQKRAMLAYRGNVPIGVCVYQRHPNIPGAIEIKNLSVTPDAQGRYIGAFLLRNTELEGTQNDFPECYILIGDTKITNLEMINFLIGQGYFPQEITDLYKTDTSLDITLTKTLLN